MTDELNKPFVIDTELILTGEKALSESYDVRTICNVIRKINRAVPSDASHKEEVKHLCCEAIVMAKRMDAHLRKYKMDWDKGLWLPEASEEPRP